MHAYCYIWQKLNSHVCFWQMLLSKATCTALQLMHSLGIKPILPVPCSNVWAARNAISLHDSSTKTVNITGKDCSKVDCDAYRSHRVFEMSCICTGKVRSVHSPGILDQRADIFSAWMTVRVVIGSLDSLTPQEKNLKRCTLHTLL